MADLAKIRAVVKRWVPRVPPVAIGAVAVVGGAIVGATLMTLAVRALAAAGASKGDLVIAVAGVVAFVSANALWWWFWGRDRAAKARAADRLTAAWSERAAEYRVYIADLERENTQLRAQVESLTPGEVVSLLTKRMGQT
ncbi:hypothetical protein ACIBQX_11695 [Nonomuraea sp. NPDC049714]|uniref:hypothetical protein n=1 Tax=Nonomuraea sp. NPDC049714 TaxID=3364357 RepID=UPI0037A000DB